MPNPIPPICASAFWSHTARGFVAVTWKGHDEPAHTHTSGGEAEELVDETDFACHSWLCQGGGPRRIIRVTLEALDTTARRFHALEAAGRPDHALERSMIRLDDVVQVFQCRSMTSFRAAALQSAGAGWPSGTRPACRS